MYKIEKIELVPGLFGFSKEVGEPCAVDGQWDSLDKAEDVAYALECEDNDYYVEHPFRQETGLDRYYMYRIILL